MIFTVLVGWTGDIMQVAFYRVMLSISDHYYKIEFYFFSISPTYGTWESSLLSSVSGPR